MRQNTENIVYRIRPGELALIDLAAERTGKTRSDFCRGAAVTVARAVVGDRAPDILEAALVDASAREG